MLEVGDRVRFHEEWDGRIWFGTIYEVLWEPDISYRYRVLWDGRNTAQKLYQEYKLIPLKTTLKEWV